jgi:hypothetical protein
MSITLGSHEMTTSGTSARPRGRLGVALAAALVCVLAVAAPASAAPPTNDDIGSPRIVGSLPYTDGPYDTTEATTGPTDPAFCFSPEAGPDRATVWYSFTPAESGSFQADTFGSDFDTTLQVGTANAAGGIDVIACNDDAGTLQSAIRWNASANTTYLIVAGTCCGSEGDTEGGGGSLVLHVDVGAPPLSLDFAVTGGSFHKDGTATIRGTIACSSPAENVLVEFQVSQRVGRLIIRGWGYAFLPSCVPEGTVWEGTARGDGIFAGGPAEVSAYAFVCSFECVDTFADVTVRLRH